MKYKILVLLFLPFLSFAQPKLDINKILIGSAIGFMGGVASGYHEVTLHHYPKFKAIHPYANDEYFNPELSWVRKYKDWPLNTDARYFGSKDILVWTTDFYHLTNTIDRISFLSATLVVTIGEKKPWWHYAINVGSTLLARRIGFGLVYDYIYK
ncbi:hypothetical protein EKK58_07615 [Candidatus Dependentiae bacterium]|nr:MAG: hypothetical protein EKK58_07615 [Candidatus Dependentiae bacterium]